MIFDTEQWTWLQTQESIVVGNLISNILVLPDDKIINVEIPMDFYGFFRAITTPKDRDEMSRNKNYSTFYLSRREGKYIFGVEINNKQVDMWDYKKLPAWA